MENFFVTQKYHHKKMPEILILQGFLTFLYYSAVKTEL